MVGTRHTTATTENDGYERLFRSLLWRMRPRGLQREVEKRLAALDSKSFAPFSRVYEIERDRIIGRLLAVKRKPGHDSPRKQPASSQSAVSRLRTLLAHELAKPPPMNGVDFQCDAGLGGLARWLRAYGYDAQWWPGIDDDSLLTKVAGSSSILLTNDTRLAHRGVLVDGVLPSLLVPISMRKRQQLAHVVQQLNLPIKSPHCMACSGILDQVDKHNVRDRIPPRTFPWRDSYWLCRDCDKLYWEGTHWKRIADTLNQCAATQHGGPAGAAAIET